MVGGRGLNSFSAECRRALFTP